MFFIVIISMFLMLSGSLFSLSSAQFMPSQAHPVFFAFSMIFLALAFIFFIAGFFVNMEKYSDMTRWISNVKKHKSELKNVTDAYSKIKVELVKYLAECYPDFEKDVFEKMAPTDKSELMAYFVKYPELKTNMMFQLLIKDITAWEHKLLEINKEIAEDYHDIRLTLYNRWLLIHPDIPDDIKSEL